MVLADCDLLGFVDGDDFCGSGTWFGGFVAGLVWGCWWVEGVWVGVGWLIRFLVWCNGVVGFVA